LWWSNEGARVSVPINLDLNMLMPAPIVNVPSSPPVNVRNEVNVPQAQSITIRRDSDGKITGADIERDG